MDNSQQPTSHVRPYNIGRPRMYDQVEDMERAMLSYFDWAEENKKPITLTGMCLFLGVSKSIFVRYKERADFKYLIDMAKQRCEDWLVENMLTNKTNPTAAIFNLKNHYGWKDQAQLDITSDGQSVFSPEQLKVAATELLNSSENPEEDSVNHDSLLELANKKDTEDDTQEERSDS